MVPAFALSSFQCRTLCIEEISPMRVGKKYFYNKTTFGSTALVENCCNKVITLVDVFSTFSILLRYCRYSRIGYALNVFGSQMRTNKHAVCLQSMPHLHVEPPVVKQARSHSYDNWQCS